ncbi:MAG: hypothetical protein ABEJ31_07700 [Haloarculaceae archaeon]
MGNETAESADEISISVHITGQYDDVVAKLDGDSPRSSDIEALVGDVEALLSTIRRTGGGTRSALAEALPAETRLAGDAEAVVDALQLLERFDLVSLDGNTWEPGAALGSGGSPDPSRRVQ